MTLVILYMLTVFVGREPVYIAHARPNAEERAAGLATAFEVAARDFELPPRLLMALAYTESGFDGGRVGKVGERGIMQLHPRLPAGRVYARACPGPSMPCDAWSVYLGAEALAYGLAQCGTLGMAVGFYKSGRCVEGPMSRRVLSIWQWAEGV